MPIVPATRVRAGRAAAIVAAFQSAKVTPATVFNGSEAAILWNADAEIPVGIEKTAEERGYMTQLAAPDQTEIVGIGDKPAGAMVVHATPASVEWLLKNSWGAFSGGAFTLESQIAATRWLTLALVENDANANGKLVRISDAWFHRLQFLVRGPEGIVEILGDYAAEVITPADLPAGGITLPSTYSPNKNIFAGADAQFVRDPAGANVGIRVYELDLDLDQGLVHEWDMFRGKWTVYKSGRTEARVRLVGVVSDETWAIITNSRAGTKQQFRFTATAPSPAKTLTINLYGMDFRIRPIGRIGNTYRVFEALGRAHVTGGNYVSIALA